MKTLHEKMEQWLFNTADHYDIVDSFDDEENYKEYLQELPLSELAQAIKYVLTSEKPIYMYGNYGATKNAVQDAMELLQEYENMSKCA